MKKLNLILSVIMFGFLVASCDKGTSKNYPVNVKMTDAPGPYDAVLIDLQEVEITGSDGQAVMMNVNAGVYNLLDFSNGVDTLIATGALEVAAVEQIRLILGPNNSVIVNGVSYPLSTPSAEQSGLKLQVHQTLEAGVLYSIVLDFDANKSIVLTGNRTYKLKPVIRTIETAMSGAIRGIVAPIGTLAIVTASIDTLSYSSNVSETGNFMLKGLPAGTYSLRVTPTLPLGEFILNDITVSTGVTTTLDTIVLQ